MNLKQAEQMIRASYRKLFGTDEIDGEANFFMLGGTSLNAVKLSAMLYQLCGVRLSAQEIYNHAYASELAEVITEKCSTTAPQQETVTEPDLIPAPEQAYEPFPLTDIQYAYWVGKNAGTEMGGVITHSYMELETAYTDVNLWNEALNAMTKRHPMLRCRILSDGTQQILQHPDCTKIPAFICNTEAEWLDCCQKIRKDSESAKQELTDEKHFDLKLCIYGEKATAFLIFDSIIFDGKSMFVLLDELETYFKEKNSLQPPSEITFRDYAIAFTQKKSGTKYEEDKAYYTQRLEQFKKLPEFYGIYTETTAHVISHHRYIADSTVWNQFKKICAENQITANCALMELYAEMIALWSSSFAFTINFTSFSRDSVKYEKELTNMIGDFTKLLLVPVVLENGSSFVERTKKLMQDVSDALHHNHFGTIDIERLIAKKEGVRNYSFPVVFTGMVDLNSDLKQPGRIRYLSSETSQVWLDMQVMEINDTLEVHFDTAESMFPYTVAEEMLSAFVKAFLNVTEHPEQITHSGGLTVKTKQYPIREQYNSVTAPLTKDTLDSLFIDMLKQYPDAPAVLSEQKCLTYQELYQYAMSLKEEIENSQDRYIAVMLPKGIYQPIAVLAVLFAGKSYVPVDLENPADRRKKILASVGTSTVITLTAEKEKASEMHTEKIILADQISVKAYSTETYQKKTTPDASAYVIFTSGSTGVPKGVEISHRGAVNTILDVNRRFAIGSTDRTIALSNLNFDLSVYDIFGMFACGGAIVELEADDSRNAEKWIQLIQKFHVSVWNSVPAFMQMLLEYVGEEGKQVFANIRRVLLSGDKIAITIPDKIHDYHADTMLICLGGATEASIWSNYYIADHAEPSWKMMPYGYPLTNQKYYVLNRLMTDCPDYVKGRLYIGGAGLAEGYHGDIEKTAEKFVIHPLTGERIYDTGDNGRYWKDGTIEFIGRDDFQVKINGHRIELGEIEAIYSEKFDSCCAVVPETGSLKHKICLLVKSDKQISKETLHQLAVNKLPHYMIPTAFSTVSKLPVNTNGKIDRKQVQSYFEAWTEPAPSTAASVMTETELKIAALWKEILGENDYSPEDDFFACGGDSLMMMRFLNKLNKTEHIRITPDVFYSATTIAEFAAVFGAALQERKA